MIYPVILAGGKSSRFKSTKTKVFHEILGKPILFHIIDTLKTLNLSPIFVILSKNYKELFIDLPQDIVLVEQKVPLGTGDAVRTVFDYIEDDNSDILVLPGDAPLITPNSVKLLIEKHREEKNTCTFLTAILDNPTGYGRIIRKKGFPYKIVEEIDTTPKEREIKEVNTGIYIFKTSVLKEVILDIKPDNMKGEYYITDCIEILVARKERVNAHTLEEPEEMLGINTREDYERVFKVMRDRVLKKWMDEGVTIMDKSTTYIEVDVEIGNDTIIYPMVYLMGKTKIGRNTRIGPMVIIKDSVIKDNEEIKGPQLIENRTL